MMDIIYVYTEDGGAGVEIVGKINHSVYKLAASSIDEDDVVVTDERIEHIKYRHPGDWEKFGEYLWDVIDDPDIMLGDENPYTAISIKRIVFENEDKYVRATIRLHVAGDEVGRVNSILSYQKINKKEYGRLSRSKKVLYRKDNT